MEVWRIVRILAGAVASGLLLGLALPPYGVWPLGWVALVPLFATVVEAGLLVGFVAGLLTGLLPAILLANGLVPVPHPMEGDATWIYGGFLLFGAFLGAMGALVGESKRFGLGKAAAFAAVGVLLAYLLTLILPEHVALTQSRFWPALVLSSITGIWGVSFWVWLTNFALVASLGSARRLVWIAASWLFLSLLFTVLAPPDVGENNLRVAVVQTRSTDLGILSQMTSEATQRGARLCIWPELSGVVAAPAGNTAELKKGSTHLSAFITTFEDSAQPKPHNAAALFDGGRESERYFKRRPFAGEANKHAAGTRPVAVSWGDTQVGLNICYDSCYPAIIRDTARLPGVQLIALPTLDPVSSGGVVQSLHAAYTPFRAAENGITIARADVSGYSMIVSPSGTVQAELGVDDGIASGVIMPPRETIYRRLGDWFVLTALIGVLASAIGALRLKLQRR
ncbi:MAG: hypothetical protein HYR64_08805 [Fimbriimonas ginsengisoli]|uniref:CN hydrolase domain-containing protein n=1 Tax=Fimbriimonas ginsengisoli TaxID=1005039 RepID=A0A931LTS1_FIMGI|nr:hypothetical protein [Fimbriimonas ginsengisoli]